VTGDRDTTPPFHLPLILTASTIQRSLNQRVELVSRSPRLQQIVKRFTNRMLSSVMQTERLNDAEYNGSVS
jgi:hypothetical protein